MLSEQVCLLDALLMPGFVTHAWYHTLASAYLPVPLICCYFSVAIDLVWLWHRWHASLTYLVVVGGSCLLPKSFYKGKVWILIQCPVILCYFHNNPLLPPLYLHSFWHSDPN